jgi:small conductance mechanosensitive channel
MPFAQYFDGLLVWLSSNGLRILITVVAASLGLRLVNGIIERSFRRLRSSDPEMQKRADTVRSLLCYAADTAIIAVSAITVLGELGIDIAPVLAAAGIVGVAVGFGSQQLVQDVISGFFILLEDQVRVGDTIETAGKSGVVERVTLRTTVLRDGSGGVHYIRNGRIDVVTNLTKGYSYYVLELTVNQVDQADDVIATVQRIGEEIRLDPNFASDVTEPIEVLGVEKLTGTQATVKARIKTKPAQQWKVGRELNLRLAEALGSKVQPGRT